MRARAPASSANLGPGFDTLALALSCYVEVELTPASRFCLETEGEGADLPADEGHLAAVVARRVLGHDRFALRVSSAIPIGRGLGSSAALAAAAAGAAGAEDPLAVAAAVDGHPENAAASVLGGLVAATFTTAGPIARRLVLDSSLRFVVLVPDRDLLTKTARGVLAPSVPFADAVANLGAMGLLVAGLADARALVAEAGTDRLHQDARAALFPEAPELLARLRAAGAVVSCWSGAGPSLLAICRDRAAAGRVREGAEAALGELGVPGRALEVAADLEGLVVIPEG